jgi:hypothetical protein
MMRRRALMDTGVTPAQRARLLPLGGRQIDFAEWMRPDQKVFEYATYMGLPLDDALRFADQMNNAVARRGRTTPEMIVTRVDKAVERDLDSLPASRAAIDKAKTEGQVLKTRLDEVRWEQERSAPTSDAMTQVSYLPEVPGHTSRFGRPDLGWSAAGVKGLRDQYRVIKENAAKARAERDAATSEMKSAPKRQRMAAFGKPHRKKGVRESEVLIGETPTRVDASIAPNIDQVNKAGFTTKGSHSGMRADHTAKAGAADTPGYIEFVDDNKVVRDVAKKHGLQIAKQPDGSLIVRFPDGATRKAWDSFTDDLVTHDARVKHDAAAQKIRTLREERASLRDRAGEVVGKEPAPVVVQREEQVETAVPDIAVEMEVRPAPTVVKRERKVVSRA